MPYLEETNFCAIQEYTKGFFSRVLETSVQLDEIYTLMMRLDKDERAAHSPIRMIDARAKTGMSVVRFALLDKDLNPRTERVQAMVDGLIIDNEGSLTVYDSSKNIGYIAKQAYLKDYNDDQFGNLLVNSRELCMV
jgi:hypothetical protein